MLFEDGSRAAIDLMEAKFEILDKASVVSSAWLVSRASLCLGGG